MCLQRVLSSPDKFEAEILMSETNIVLGLYLKNHTPGRWKLEL